MQPTKRIVMRAVVREKDSGKVCDILETIVTFTKKGKLSSVPQFVFNQAHDACSDEKANVTIELFPLQRG